MPSGLLHTTGVFLEYNHSNHLGRIGSSRCVAVLKERFCGGVEYSGRWYEQLKHARELREGSLRKPDRGPVFLVRESRLGDSPR